jgi:hypothetical protein
MEAYRLAAVATIRAVERVLAEQPAFGPDPILGLGKTGRFDQVV